MNTYYSIEELLKKETEEINLNEYKSFVEWLKLANESKIKNLKQKSKKMEIISKFIETNPKIEKIENKDKQETPKSEMNSSKKEELNNIVSETLAKIYVEQKFFDSAIEVYKKLHLIFPEKKTYFATRIKEVKKLVELNKDTK
jgi:tetratricopeptide (TPR) repeat protein